VEKFVRFFESAGLSCAVVQVPGRQYPVQTWYTRTPEPSPVEAAAIAAWQVHESGRPGDVLVFLPGQEEIEDCAELLLQREQAWY
jgi:HrpA-like RNA helicase